MTIALTLSHDSRTTDGILLLTLVVVEYGGWSVLRLTRGAEPATELQKAFARAGHGHAGVLVVLALIAQVLVDATTLSGVPEILARDGVWAAAVLFPAGFFLSSAGRGVTEPNRAIALVYLGALCLAAGVVTLGVGLLTA